MSKLFIPDLIGRHVSGGRGGHRHRPRLPWYDGGYGGYGEYGGAPWHPEEEIVELEPGLPPVLITRAPRVVTLLGAAGPATRDERCELADLGAVIAPGSRGLSARVELGPDGHLHATICVDGEIYRGSADVSAVLARIVDRIASEHADHVGVPAVAQSPAAVSDAAAAANHVVSAAGDMLVGALLDQHQTTVSAGWWHSLTHSITSAVDGVQHAVRRTISKFKAPISVAATTVATVYGGPAGGAAAARLTGPIIDAVGDDGKKKQQAQAVINVAKAAARTDPAAARALADAQRAVVDTAAVYHITSTAAQAAAGDPEAAQKVADLDQAASSGDPAARQAMAVITRAFSTAAGNADGGGTAVAPTTSGSVAPWLAAAAAAGLGGAAWWRYRHRAAAAAPGAAPATGVAGAWARSAGDIVGASLHDLREEARAVVDPHRSDPAGSAFGYVKDDRGAALVLPFHTLDEADDWFGALDRRRFQYAAYFDATDPTWPTPANETLGGGPVFSARAARGRIPGGGL